MLLHGGLGGYKTFLHLGRVLHLEAGIDGRYCCIKRCLTVTIRNDDKVVGCCAVQLGSSKTRSHHILFENIACNTYIAVADAFLLHQNSHGKQGFQRVNIAAFFDFYKYAHFAPSFTMISFAWA